MVEIMRLRWDGSAWVYENKWKNDGGREKKRE